MDIYPWIYEWKKIPYLRLAHFLKTLCGRNLGVYGDIGVCEGAVERTCVSVFAFFLSLFCSFAYSRFWKEGGGEKLRKITKDWLSWVELVVGVVFVEDGGEGGGGEAEEGEEEDWGEGKREGEEEKKDKEPRRTYPFSPAATFLGSLPDAVSTSTPWVISSITSRECSLDASDVSAENCAS